ncbi:MAG: DNA translocase FtsK 4TM domain-containing protein [bacterium]
MAKTTPKKKKQKVQSLHSRFREITGILLTAAGLYFLISLVSYSPQDVSLNSTGAGDAVNNMGGVVGAYLSDFLLQLFGWGGFLIPVLLFFLGITRFLAPKWSGWLLRASGSLLFLISACILLQLRIGETVVVGAAGREAGGILGNLLSSLMVRFLNVPGAYILAIATIFISAVMLTNVSMKIAGKGVAGVFGSIGRLITIRKERTRRHRAVSKVKETQTKRKQPPVVKKTERILKKKLSEPTQEEFAALPRPKGDFTLPPMELLDPPEMGSGAISEKEQIKRSQILEKKLKDYGVQGQVTAVNPGPVITIFEYEPSPGTKLSAIAKLEDDLSLAMGGVAVRVVRHVPGKSVVGIEVPNKIPELVVLREVLFSREFKMARGMLKLAIGKDPSGDPFVAELSGMPHLLVAGATGTGKSVAINSMILSMIYNLTPQEVRFLMVDTKMLELSPYEGIPHLLAPVVMEPKKAAAALRWVVVEMERRFQLLASHKVRDINGYNKKMAKAKEPPEHDDPHLAHIVIVIDELADLMMTAPREVEETIARLGQMARAAGIHLIIGTQRPSVDIISGNIKTNITGRMAFKVFDKANSRVILDQNGAEQLLGSGDMLFVQSGVSRLVRVHGSFVGEEEVARTVRFLRGQARPEYRDDVFDYEAPSRTTEEHEADEKYDEVLKFVFERGYASASMIQRRFKVGYNRAARMVEKMESEGIVGPPDGAKARPVLKRIEIE